MSGAVVPTSVEDDRGVRGSGQPTRRSRVLVAVSLALAVMATARADGRDDRTHESATRPTLTVLTFVNRRAGDGWDWLGKGLADMLATDLQTSGSFQVVDRERMQFVFDEMELAGSGLVESASARDLGKILQVDLVVFGSFFRDSGRIEIESHIADVHAGALRRVEWVRGAEVDAHRLAKRLALKILENQGVTLTAAERQSLLTMPTESLDAARQLYLAMDAVDRGRHYEGLALLLGAIKADPKFGKARLWCGRTYRRLGQAHHAELEFRRLAETMADDESAAEAGFRRAKVIEKCISGQAEAAAVYEDVARRFPGTGWGLVAGYRAGVLAYQTDQLERAVSILQYTRGLGRDKGFPGWNYLPGFAGYVEEYVTSLLATGQLPEKSRYSCWRGMDTSGPLSREMPVICYADLAEQRRLERVDGELVRLPSAEGGVFNPMLLRTHSGRYLLVFNDQCTARLTTMYGGDADIWLAESRDGHVWSDPRRLPINGDGHDLHPWLMEDREHRLRLVWSCQRVAGRVFQVCTSVSSDGVDWSLPRVCQLKWDHPSKAWLNGEWRPALGLYAPSLAQLRDGSFRLAYLSFVGTSAPRAAGRLGFASSEDGLTWQEYPAFTDRTRTGPISLQVVQDSLFLAAGLYETCEVKVSRDGGKTWSDVTGFPAYKFGVLSHTPDGPLVLSGSSEKGGMFYAVSDDGAKWVEQPPLWAMRESQDRLGVPFVLVEREGKRTATWGGHTFNIAMLRPHVLVRDAPLPRGQTE